jgi:hypothetical protein
MATLLKVLNNLPIPNRRGVLHFASELRLSVRRRIERGVATNGASGLNGFVAAWTFLVTVLDQTVSNETAARILLSGRHADERSAMRFRAVRARAHSMKAPSFRLTLPSPIAAQHMLARRAALSGPPSAGALQRSAIFAGSPLKSNRNLRYAPL